MGKLIHDKKQGVFIWNQIRDSGDLDKKVVTIKKGGRWKKVRDDYQDFKNGYLKEGDRNHPSFIVYIQAVNVAHYVSFIRVKSATNCDAQLTESNFQTRSREAREDGVSGGRLLTGDFCRSGINGTRGWKNKQ